MLLWLNIMTFENGSIPLLNDSANGIAPTTEQLNNYAYTLNSTFNIQHSTLKSSGYRKITKSNYECIIDIGHIGPDYIPGHAHADTFNFELHIDNKPFIVDTGLSTYETNAKRTAERSTSAHNTVEVNHTSSSEVWSGFRVADRAYVNVLEENDEKIMAEHSGYEKKFGIIHIREWHFKEDEIIIKDRLNSTANGIARLHFHPDVTEEMIKNHITVGHAPSENALGVQPLTINHYQYAPEFNKLVDALVLEIVFKKELEVSIRT